MPYDVACWDLAEAFGQDRGLTDAEISRLAQHIQDEVELELDYLLTVRKESHATLNDPR